jgi:hypothetical protein
VKVKVKEQKREEEKKDKIPELLEAPSAGHYTK